MNRRDFQFVSVVFLAVMGLSTAAYLYALFATPPGMHFMGWLASPSDHNAFLAWIRQSMDGHFVFSEKFTTEVHQQAFVRPLWLLVGKVSVVVHASPVLIYHLARIAAALLLLLTVYSFASMFFKSRRLRRVTVALCAVSAGFGWLFALRALRSGGSPYYTVDLYAPEAITFRSMHSHLHFTVAMILMLWIFIFTIRSLETKRVRLAAAAGLLGFLLAFEHPYDMVTIYTTLAIFLLMVSIKTGGLPLGYLPPMGIVVGISMLPITYNFFFLQRDPVFRGWAAQNVVLSPRPDGFVLGYGVILVLAAVGVPACLKLKGERALFLFGWVIAVTALVYSPFSFQLKFILGIHVALCVLATFGLAVLLRWLGMRTGKRGSGLMLFSRGLTLLIIASTAPTNLAAIANDMFFHKRRDAFPIYMPNTVVEAFAWLRDNTQREETVLSAPLTGNFLPGWGGNRVFVGHWSETLNVLEKERMTQSFYRGETAKSTAFLKSYGICYVFYGPEEKRLGESHPLQWEGLDKVFENAEVAIFRTSDAHSTETGP